MFISLRFTKNLYIWSTDNFTGSEKKLRAMVYPAHYIAGF